MGGKEGVRPLIAGNWKMNGLQAALAEIAAMARGYDQTLAARLDLLVCPPATLLAAAAGAVDGNILTGGQDCHGEASGAFTGDISAQMLADAGAKYVILGHSERRSLHGESDVQVRAKALAARAAGLCPVVCVGELEGERRAGRALAVVAGQLEGSLPVDATPDNLVIAYEPVWAIGTGLTPTADDVAQMHTMIRTHLSRRYGVAGQGMRILYGGSVKPSNARELMAAANVNGALVGGASLKAADFLAIARAV
ncbi:MAG: triose-phosphate isomerase [Alphaproteobacteria bacterium]|nr:triose-phosphate isomerase [Alphaproteobacteria bacterium]